MPKKIRFSASVLCAHLGHLERDIKALEAAGCDELHFSASDAVFTSQFGLSFDFIRMAKDCCKLPCHTHLMAERPERLIPSCAEAGADIITVHLEASVHIHRTLGQIRDASAKAGLALNPVTPLTKVEHLLGLTDRVLLLNTEMDGARQTITQGAFERVAILHKTIEYQELRTDIAVCGDLGPKNAALLARQGAGVFVLDRSNVFQGETDVATAFTEFTQAMERERNLV